MRILTKKWWKNRENRRKKIYEKRTKTTTSQRKLFYTKYDENMRFEKIPQGGEKVGKIILDDRYDFYYAFANR